MKKFFIPIMILVITLTLNYAASRVESAGANAYYFHKKICDLKTVTIEKSSLFGFTSSVAVEGWKCNGSDNAGQGYKAEIWDHVFWLL